jgi:hypothetical protein
MHISGADFGALVEDLAGALDKFKVGKTEKDQLLGALAPMKAISSKRANAGTRNDRRERCATGWRCG